MSENTESPNKIANNEENEEEPSVSMWDILQEQKEQEEEYAAVLGGSDEKCCTYSQGPIKRQALYSCLTCCPEAKPDPSKCAGVCLACSYQCHGNHELVELYTKRNFRCDCPTIKVPGNKCTFVEDNGNAEKFPVNADNSYNQNFSGTYCTCKRPYPDPDDPIPDEMIQCVMCEDWFHTRHLETTIPMPDAYAEIICGSCVHSSSFLKDYTGLAVNKIESTTESPGVSVVEEDDKLKSELEKSISDIMNMSSASAGSDGSTDGPQRKKLKYDGPSDTCKRHTLKSDYQKGGLFLAGKWRDCLCKCPDCIKIYKTEKVEFLLDPEDTVEFYELNGLKKVRESEYEIVTKALSSLGHVQKIEAIMEYNKMKDKLKEFLHTFAVTQKVVTEADVNAFFQGMTNERNARLGQPYFCR